jgi:hypothetical protein
METEAGHNDASLVNIAVIDKRRSVRGLVKDAPSSIQNHTFAAPLNSEGFTEFDDPAVNELGSDGHFYYCSACGEMDGRLLICEGYD